MKHFFPSILLPAILSTAMLSCARMPAIAPVPSQAAAPIREACTRAFPDGDWQLVHAITTTMAGRRGMMIGVSVISAQPRTVRCALMSLEGLVMFEAREEDGTITVDRAIAPFDNPDFARGMLDDIRMIFFQPGPRPDDIGLTASDTPVCRYRTGPGQTVDVEAPPSGGWTLRRYEGDTLVRTVQAGPETLVTPRGERFSRQMQLTARGARPYKLDLKLLEAVPLSDTPQPKKNSRP